MKLLWGTVFVFSVTWISAKDIYVPLDSYTKQYILRWTFNKSSKLINFNLSLQDFKPNHFFVIGFSDKRSVLNGHMCALWKGSTVDHTVKFQSISTDSEGIVTTDNSTTCDITDIQATPEEFRVMFHRHFNTSKPLEYVIDDGTTHIVYATGPLESGQFDDLKLTNYTTGVAFAQLIHPVLPVVPIPPDTHTFDLLYGNDVVPGDVDVMCRLIKLPPIFRQKQHVIHIEPIVDSRNVQYLHHMGLWHCPIYPDIEIPAYQGSCYGSSPEDQPMISKVCNDKIIISAPPFPDVYFPPGVGFPIGGENYSSYVVLNVHYFRPEKQDIVDNSGFRLYVTTLPQPYEASIITAQIKLQMPLPFLPPNQEKFTLKGEVHSETTKQLFPTEGINIFAIRFHAHANARALRAYHFRNNEFVEDISADNHYDTKYQYERQLENLINIKQGDAIRYECDYNTLASKNITYFDFLSTDEMCMLFLFYYPRINVGDCNDNYDLPENRQAIAKLNKNGEKIADFWNLIETIEWDNQTSQRAQDIFTTAKREGSCDPKHVKHDQSQMTEDYDHDHYDTTFLPPQEPTITPSTSRTHAPDKDNNSATEMLPKWSALAISSLLILLRN